MKTYNMLLHDFQPGTQYLILDAGGILFYLNKTILTLNTWHKSDLSTRNSMTIFSIKTETSDFDNVPFKNINETRGPPTLTFTWVSISCHNCLWLHINRPIIETLINKDHTSFYLLIPPVSFLWSNFHIEGMCII